MKLLPPSEFEKPKATAGGILPEVKSAADEILALKLENQRLRYYITCINLQNLCLTIRLLRLVRVD